MARHRLGVVLLIPEPVRREVEGLRRAVGDRALGRVPPHVTLVPPVNVAADDLDTGLRVLRDAAARMDPFDLQLGPASSFHPVSPVVYLAVGGDVGAVHRLHDLVFTRPFHRSISHAFVPHVTLADDVPVERIAAAQLLFDRYLVEVAIDRLHLLREVWGPGGERVWEPWTDVAFGPVAVVGRGGLELGLWVSTLVPPDAAPLAEGHEGSIGRAAGEGLVVTGRRDGRAVGVAAGTTLGGVGYLDLVAVSAEHRHEGVGAHLVAAFESACADRGCVEVLAAIPDEPVVLALLARRGWARHQDGPSRRDWTAGEATIRRTDALLLRRRL